MKCPVGYYWDGYKCVKLDKSNPSPNQTPNRKPMPNYSGEKPRRTTMPNRKK